jgi:aryl-alcohol dehydrogenase-like predicted oxidoreductase
LGVVSGEEDQPSVPPSQASRRRRLTGIRAGQPFGPTQRETIDNTAVTEDVFAALEDLVDEGMIRSCGWSTDDPDAARRLAGRRRATALQFSLNVLSDAPDMLAACDDLKLTGLARTPLAMGLLTGKFDAGSRLPADDVRGSGHSWLTYFRNARPDLDALDRLAAIREILTSNGRTLAQGALAWVLARGPQTVPIPEFKSLAQVKDRGPLTPGQMAEIETLLDRQVLNPK